MAHARFLPFVAACAGLLALVLPASAQEWLSHGDFEVANPGDGWRFTEATAAVCTPHEGSGALGIDTEDSVTGRMSYDIAGPLPAGVYTLTGWVRVGPGTGRAAVLLAFEDANGQVGDMRDPQGLVSNASYSPFTATVRTSRTATSATLSFDLAPDGFAVLCIDSLQLTTEDATPTPSPSATPTPEPTTSPVPSATATTAPATSTSTPAASASPTPSSSPTPTLTPGPTFTFTNGGFEAGLEGWSKYGGTLTTTSNALSGSTSGLLISDTDSTKWAYQAVRIEANQYYQFSASLRADGGVREAYLRISWYATQDASGSALSTTDSTHGIGPGGAESLTTGAVLPPAGAASARVRVLLVPQGAGSASLTIDDVSFGTTAAPTATPSPSPTATSTASSTPLPSPTVAMLGAIPSTPIAAGSAPEPEPPPLNESTVRASAASAPEGPTTAAVAPSATAARVAEVAATRTEAGASAPETTASRPTSFSAAPEPRTTFPWPWAVGVTLLVVGLGGAYWQNRRPAQ